MKERKKFPVLAGTIILFLGQYAGILGNSITEMKTQECAYLHNANDIIILMLDIDAITGTQ